MLSQNAPQLAVYPEPPVDPPTHSTPSHFATCESLCEVFSRATGSTLQFSTGHRLPTSAGAGSSYAASSDTSFSTPAADFSNPLWSAMVRSPPFAGQIQLMGQRETNDPAQSEAVLELAQMLSALLEGFFDARTTAEKLACEIATLEVAPSKPATVNLGQRLQRVLQTMVETLHCSAAGLYVLDDATSALQLRTNWGLPVDALTREPRILETAKADLEAMLGHAVVISNKQMFELWQVPEMDYEAAVCVPLSTATTVLGTVWLYHTQPRSFGDQEVNLIEVLTGRLAMELEYAALQVPRPLSG
ncbi:MAG: hypothetical protein CBB70_01925 [Planctomycetaceae bacterium TMED10]|nr:MAG: hypothetical protein CBB70_01925 [Planctomycetaceae bacterium TMED10]